MYDSLQLPLEVFKNGKISPILLKSYAKDAKFERIDNSINFPSGNSLETKVYTTIWRDSEYFVKLGKPGKEVFRKLKVDEKGWAIGKLNTNDMTPTMYRGNQIIEKPASFTEIFAELIRLNETNKESLELLGCLFFRSAFLLDHIKRGNNWCYEPSEEVINKIESDVGTIAGLPVRLFLHFLDALAWNEDTKYFTTMDAKKLMDGVGRINNLLTCVHLITCLLGKTDLASFLGKFAQMRGVSVLTPATFIEALPHLKPEGLDIIV